jgi:hypothetical protein
MMSMPMPMSGGNIVKDGAYNKFLYSLDNSSLAKSQRRKDIIV